MRLAFSRSGTKRLSCAVWTASIWGFLGVSRAPCERRNPTRPGKSPASENLVGVRLWLISLWLFSSCGPVFGQAGLFPPDGCILLTEQSSVILRWPASSSSYRLELTQDGRLQSTFDLATTSIAVPVKPGGHYHWSVTPKRGQPLSGTFSVSEEWEYHADGAEDSGESGRNISVRLERLGDGMQMKLKCGRESRLYLFTSPGRHFLLSSRGARGCIALSYEFQDLGGGDARDPYPAGNGGWGGIIEILTKDAPWRDYLEVDVSPGKGGSGAWADTTDGTAGKSGRVVTKILP